MTPPTRREILRLLGMGCVATAAPAALPSYARAQDVSVEEWMEAWMKSRRVAEGPLHLSRFAEPMYFLLRPIAWRPDPGQAVKYQAVDVPTGFVTDLASVPRPFWSLLRPDGEYAYAAIIHDFLYWTQTRPREVADRILLLAMNDFGIEADTTTIIYSAVRLAGAKAWAENAKLKLNGEKRILKRFPEDPTTRWSDWKKQPNVFL